MKKLLQYYRNYSAQKAEKAQILLVDHYLKSGRVPWSPGYVQYKNQQITQVISDTATLAAFKKDEVPPQYGYKLDERIVEYAWLFSRLPTSKVRLLDAGSTFNFDFIVNHPQIENKELSILTYAPESPSYPQKRISYVYADLRDIPFKSQYFDYIVSQSTIEHIDMDNSIFGYEVQHHTQKEEKSYEYLKALEELLRVLKPQGTLLLTFPFGKFENHGFFQQFDDEMLAKALTLLNHQGSSQLSFFRYLPAGWIACSQEDCKNIVSYNPHTGRGKGDDGAAHCRSICCIAFNKT